MAEGPKLTLLGKLVILAFLGACFYGAYYFLFQGTGENVQSGAQPGAGEAQHPNSPPPRSGGGGFFGGNKSVQAEIGIAYGTEKRQWLEWAVEEFARTPEGATIRINLMPMGSLEGAKAVTGGDKGIHVWSPASSVYKDIFVQDWQVRHGMNANPIVREELLALSPMVLVAWDDRYQVFKRRYGKLSFTTLSQALAEPGGWDSIAGKPEWGLFKFGHTHPNESNSGLLTLILMAYDYSDTCRNLAVKDIVDLGFQQWLQKFEQAVSGLSNSTGTLMREMILKGPSAYDALFVYENVAIDYLKNAEGRWGTLHVEYPEKNMWNDNPYYILDTPWSSEAQQQAAAIFLEFLLSEPVQKRSLEHGFRPGNPNIPVKFPESPFVKYQKYGLQVDVPQTCDPPAPDVINNLLNSWQRAQGGR